MKSIEVPGFGRLEIEHLVLDYNGTLARDGELEEGVSARLSALAADLRIHVVTADTYGGAAYRLMGLPCEVTVIPQDEQDAAKAGLVRGLGPRVAAIGNGRNDVAMLREASLGIAVIQEEGASAAALAAADVVCRSIRSALDLFSRPRRLVATLRS